MPVLRARAAALGVLALGAAATPVSAAPPANDDRRQATPLAIPDRVSASLREATPDRTDPNPFCGPRLGPSVWYRLPAVVSGRAGVEIRAAAGDGTLVAVFRQERGVLVREDCDVSDRRGVAAVRFQGDGASRYLVQVASGTGAEAGPFTLTTFRPDPEPSLPAAPLRAGRLTGVLDPVRDPEDAASVRLDAGVTHRVAIHSRGAGCARALVLPPGTADLSGTPAAVLGCDGYATLTPGPGEGGRYTVVPFVTRTTPAPARYRLFVARAGRDDLAPGTALPVGRRVTGVVAGRGVDRVDVHSLRVGRRSRVRVRLTTAGAMDMSLYTQGGRLLDCACDSDGDLELERATAPGTYMLVVRAFPGRGGRYRLLRTERTITSARTTADGGRTAVARAGAAVRLAVRVTPAPAGGRVTMDVEGFDPVEGWLFRRRFTPPVAGGVAAVTWVVPAAGRWRVRGAYLGSPADSPSPAGTALITAR